MKLRGYKLLALLKKDFKLLLCNKNTIFMAMLPIIFAILYRFIFSDISNTVPEMTYFVIVMCSLMNMSIVPISILSMMVAEEKEKNTMRTLMLCDVSSLEFLFSKALVALSIVEVCSVLIFVITMTPIEYLIGYLLITMAVTFSIMAFGAVIGLLAKDQMETGTFGTPLMMLFMLPPLMGEMNVFFHNISLIFPTTGYKNLIQSLFTNTLFSQTHILVDFLVILIWGILGAIVFMYTFKRKGLDN